MRPCKFSAGRGRYGRGFRELPAVFKEAAALERELVEAVTAR